MSFCIRTISNSGRYVPTFVASAQGCSTRRLSSRQLPKHVNPVSSSLFLNDFLGSNVSQNLSLDARDDYKSSIVPKEYLNSNSTYILVQGHHLIDDCDAINIKNELDLHQISNIDHYDSLPQEISHISRTNLSKDQLILTDFSKLYENQLPITHYEENWTLNNPRLSFSAIDAVTKDQTKVNFSVLQKSNGVLHQNKINASPTKNENEDKRKAEENLEHVFQTLSVDLPRFFVKTIDYRIYNPEVEFVNNIQGKTTKGMFEYIKQLSFLRTMGHFKFAYVKMDVLKITMHTQDNTVRVRWRINGITGFRVFMQFWKFKFWKIREGAQKEQEIWYDGFSTFYVGEDGLVYKHVADKMMPDQDVEEINKSKVIPTKLATPLTFSSLG